MVFDTVTSNIKPSFIAPIFPTDEYLNTLLKENVDDDDDDIENAWWY